MPLVQTYSTQHNKMIYSKYHNLEHSQSTPYINTKQQQTSIYMGTIVHYLKKPNEAAN